MPVIISFWMIINAMFHGFVILFGPGRVLFIMITIKGSEYLLFDLLNDNITYSIDV